MCVGRIYVRACRSLSLSLSGPSNNTKAGFRILYCEIAGSIQGKRCGIAVILTLYEALLISPQSNHSKGVVFALSTCRSCKSCWMQIRVSTLSRFLQTLKLFFFKRRMGTVRLLGVPGFLCLGPLTDFPLLCRVCCVERTLRLSV